MDRLLAFFAFAVFAAFLGILIFEVPRLDLGGVVLVTFLLAAYDFATSARRKLPKPQPQVPGEAMDRPTE
jgi:hypothetical protein